MNRSGVWIQELLHMCSDESLFSTVDFSCKGVVTVEGGHKLKAYGKGDVNIVMTKEVEQCK